LVNLLNARGTAKDAVCDVLSIAALVRIREIPFRTPGKKDKPFQ